MGLEPVVYRNFISEAERLELLDHSKNIPLRINSRYKPDDTAHIANHSAPYGTRAAAKLDGTIHSTPLIKVLFDRIVNTLQLRNPVIDPMIGQIVSVIKPGGLIHLHRDQYIQPEFKHKHNLRFNIMVERGSGNSYNPIIENKGYIVNRCDAWCFSATKYLHRTQTISGPENRVVYQFGFAVDIGEQ
jgi:hypothetical protein